MYKLIYVFSIFSFVLSATITQKNTSQSNFSESGLDEKTGQVFVFKTLPDGRPSQRCQCKEYHLCHRDDIYDPNLKQDSIRCENQMHVCCILKSENISTVSSQTNTRNRPLMVKSSSEEATSTEDNCTCVTFDKCSNESYVENYGEGIIRVRLTFDQPSCDISEVCCPDMYIIKNADIKTEIAAVPEGPGSIEPTQVSVEPLVHTFETSSNSVQSITSGLNIEELFIPTQPIESQCSCVPIDSCKNDSVTDNYGAGLIEIRAPTCDLTEVCCLVSDVITEKAPISPDSSVKGNSTDESSEPECGLRKGVSTNISDSTFASFGEYPWMIGILKKGHEAEKPELICGGSLVSSNVVLTAAHCVRKIDAAKLIVRAGEYDYELEADQEQQPHQDRSVAEVRIHPFYKEGVYFNDMAVLTLDEEFHLKSHISPICLPFVNTEFSVSNVYDPTKCVAIGWGRKAHEASDTYRNSLKKIDLSLVNHEECQKKLRKTKLGPKFILHSSFICAGGEPEKDTCQGDGGGPLFCALRDNPNRYVQVGITSWGLSCGQPIPAVYTNVKANAKWLTVEINISTIFARNPTPGVLGKSMAKSMKNI